jgi:hypothetical protein
VAAGRAAPLEAGATYVFDRGYTDFRWWSEIIAADALFVTRRKKNARCRAVREAAVADDGILPTAALSWAIAGRMAARPTIRCLMSSCARWSSRAPIKRAAVSVDQ